MVPKEDNTQDTLNKKYKRMTRLRFKDSITKTVATKIAKFFFEDKLISIVPNRDKRKFDVFISDTVNDKSYTKFKNYWDSTFILHKSEE